MEQTFIDQTALISGASTGIGLAIADALLDRGASVVNLSRRAADKAHPRLTNVACDLADPAACRAAAAKVAATHDITILINNAGVVRNSLLGEISDEEFETLHNLHVRAAIILAEAVAPAMEARGAGRIVNMSSRAVVGMQKRTVYAGTKAALQAMTRTWALELGPKGVTVNAIAPGIIMTEMVTGDIPEGSAQAHKLAQGLPRRRLGQTDDIVRAALFFCDPANDWVTGQTLFVCGGASLGSFTLT